MENKEKYLKTNKRLKIGIMVFSILSLVMLIGNKSYALFSNTVKTNNSVVTINTSSEFQSKTITDTLVKKAYSNTSEIIAINKNGAKCENLEDCDVREYRYSGQNANNYIYLKDNTDKNELWRIIGVFLDEDIGKWYIRIVRNEVLPLSYFTYYFYVDSRRYTIRADYSSNDYYAYWNSYTRSTSDKSNWEEAGLQYWLNDEETGYLTKLSTETKNLLADQKVTLGLISSRSESASKSYLHERDVKNCVDNTTTAGLKDGCYIWGGPATWTGKVSLMYPSDYGYSVDSQYWTDVNLSDYDSSIASTGWMYNTMADFISQGSWLVSPASSTSANVMSTSGGVGDSWICNGAAVRPVLSLQTEIGFFDGDGTKENPYKIIESEDIFEGLAKKIIDKSYSNEKEIIAINRDGDKCENLQNCNVREYRFSGSEVNNYIYLKDNNGTNEKWRVIGIFYDELMEEWYTKVLKDELLTESQLPTSFSINDKSFYIRYNGSKASNRYEAYWNRKSEHSDSSPESNDWSYAGLQYYLNNEKSTAGSNQGYLSYLSSETKELLKEIKYYLGSISYLDGVGVNETAKSAYINERNVEKCIKNLGLTSNSNQNSLESAKGCRVWSNCTSTWTGKVSLMYPSDYGYSADSQYWTGDTKTILYEYGDNGVRDTSWIYNTITDLKSKTSWLLSPSSYGKSYASVFSYGRIGSSLVYGSSSGSLSYGVYSNGVLPVLNLKGLTPVLDGDGTSESPYKVLAD